MFLEGAEADDEVGNHFAIIVGADADRAYPWQELVIAADVGDEVKQLVGGVGKMPGLAVAGHQATAAPALASCALRASRIFLKSSPAW